MFPLQLIHSKSARMGLRYLLIGGHAVNTYGEPRATLDIDFLVPKADAPKWQALLLAEGFKLLHDGGNFLQFSPPYGVSWRFDLMLVTEDTFAKLLAGSKQTTCLDIQTRVPSPEHLIALKLHAMTHGSLDRFEKDFGDILNIARNTGLDADSPAMLEIFRRYGTPHTHETFRKRLKPKA
ncbi:MAG: nucleotidyl transferase AbiEii/AbiGii toxin family protein [Verrucomicrobiota bacterium]